MIKPPWKNPISMAVTESDLQRTCTDYLDILVAQDKVRYCVMPDGDFRRRGKGYCPDIIVWHKTFVNHARATIWAQTFELKSPKGTGRLTDKQSDFVGWIDDHSCEHYVTNDFDEFKSIIDKALEG